MRSRVLDRPATPAAMVVALAALLALVLLFVAGCGGDTVTGAPTSIVVVSPTTASTEIPAATTTTATGEVTVTSAAGPVTQTTASGPGGIWQTSPTSVQDLAALLAQQLAPGQTVYLPDRLPAGWALAAPDQEFGDIVAGYFADMRTNPSIISLEGDESSFRQYYVAFTDGTDVVGLLVVIGDWGETPFQEVTAYGKKLFVYEDEGLVAVIVPGWDQGAVVGSPGGREAALEIAAAIKAW